MDINGERAARPTSQTTARRDGGSTTLRAALLAAVVAAVAALVGNTVVAQLAFAAGASEDFQPLTVGSYGAFTIVGVLAWPGRLAAHPAHQPPDADPAVVGAHRPRR